MYLCAYAGISRLRCEPTDKPNGTALRCPLSKPALHCLRKLRSANTGSGVVGSNSRRWRGSRSLQSELCSERTCGDCEHEQPRCRCTNASGADFIAANPLCL